MDIFYEKRMKAVFAGEGMAQEDDRTSIDWQWQRFQDIDAGESAIAEAIQQIDAQKQEAAGIPSVMGSPSQDPRNHWSTYESDLMLKGIATWRTT